MLRRSGGVPAVGRVGRVGQVGRAGWYAECHSTTIKPAGLLAQKTPQTGKKPPSGGKKKNCHPPVGRTARRLAPHSSGVKNRRQAEKRKTATRLSGEQPDDWRHTPTAQFPNHADFSRRDDRAQGRRQIKAAARDPSSLKLRRDKVYLLNCLSRRNVMKPEAADRRFDKRLRTRARRTPFAIITYIFCSCGSRGPSAGCRICRF